MKKPKKPKIRQTWGELDPTTKIIPDKREEYKAKSLQEEIDNWEEAFYNNSEE